jgi:hypothetical protein
VNELKFIFIVVFLTGILFGLSELFGLLRGWVIFVVIMFGLLILDWFLRN